MEKLPNIAFKILLVSLVLVAIAGCTHKSDTPLREKPNGASQESTQEPSAQKCPVSMVYRVVGVDGCKIKLLCTLFNTSKQPQLIAEEVEVGLDWTTSDEIAGYGCESMSFEPNHYVLLPVLHALRKDPEALCSHFVYRKWVTIDIDSDIPSGFGTCEVSAGVKLLEYNEKKRCWELEEYDISCERDLSDLREQVARVKEKAEKAKRVDQNQEDSSSGKD